jgi:hypothetical protein
MHRARVYAGMTQMAVRDALGISQGTLSELEGTAASSGRIVDFARLYEVDAGWLSTGNGFEPPGGGIKLMPNPGGMDEALAHAGSSTAVTFPSQRARQFVPWRELGMQQLQNEFCVDAPDDSMAPVIKRGARVDFDRSLEPRTDDVVLLKDGGGVWYIRTFQQGPRARWGARAENGAFLAMDSERDELQVIAVFLRWPPRFWCRRDGRATAT